MRLVLALPDLLLQDHASLAAAPSLRRLAFYAPAPVLQHGRLDRPILFEATGREPAAFAPLAALGAGLDPGERYVMRADPVSLVAGRADVSLDGRVDDLDESECRALLATLNAHFGGDGLAFHAPRPDAWFITTDVPPRLATTPLPEVRGAIYPYLPGGDDAPRWRRWLSEMQMLLHEHPVNTARQIRGRTPVTGIWISEGGRTADFAGLPPNALFAPAGWAGDVARGLARLRGETIRETPADFAELPNAGSVIAILDPAAGRDIREIERRWLMPAVAALEQGALSALTLLADGHGEAAAWRAQRPGWAKRMRGRFSSRKFAKPPHSEDA